MSEPTEQIFGKSKTGDANVDDSCSLKLERAGDVNNLDDLYEKRDVVAEWQFPSHGKLHRIEFQHGTTSGKRILWIDGQVINCLKLINLKIWNSVYNRSYCTDLITNFVHLLILQEIFRREWMFKLVRCVLQVEIL